MVWAIKNPPIKAGDTRAIKSPPIKAGDTRAIKNPPIKAGFLLFKGSFNPHEDILVLQNPCH